MMRRRDVLGAAGLIATAAPARAQTASPGFALIVANSDYDQDGKVDASYDSLQRAYDRGYVGDLANPWFDGVRVRDALKGANFAVDFLINANRAMISGAIMRLFANAERAGPTARTIIYFAGHGLQIGGANYLVGVGAQVLARDLPVETSDQQRRLALRVGVPVQELLMRAKPPQAPGYNLVLIDACRDNPWEDAIRAAQAAAGRDYVGERGFVAISVMTPRTVIGFSTSPGQLALDGPAAANSAYAAGVARRLTQRGMSVDGLVEGLVGEVAAASGARQTPWSRGRLGDGTLIRP